MVSDDDCSTKLYSSFDKWVLSPREVRIFSPLFKTKSSGWGGVPYLMLGRKRRDRVCSIGEQLCLLKKGNINVLALMAKQRCSLISEQRVQI